VRAEHPIWRAVIDLPLGYDKGTRLMLAAKKGELASARSLCEWRAGLEVRGLRGKTALYYASRNGHMDCVRELIANGADVNASSRGGTTPLMSACRHGYIGAVRLLLSAGADKRRVNSRGMTAARLAGIITTNTAAIRAVLAAAP
jgi:ankyrin repeat protein